MGTSATSRSFALRLLERSPIGRLLERVDAQQRRIDELEQRLDQLNATLGGAVAQLHETVSEADPVLMRQTIEAVRDDVARLYTTMSS